MVINLLRNGLAIFLLWLYAGTALAQPGATPVFRGAIKEKRLVQHRNLINNTINKNLSLPLTDSTEENWISAFQAMEVLQYKSAWINSRLYLALDSFHSRTPDFQHALLELFYALYPVEFSSPIKNIFAHLTDSKTLALSAEYLYRNKLLTGNEIEKAAALMNKTWQQDSILYPLVITKKEQKSIRDWKEKLSRLFSPDYLKGNTVMYSIQRKNRDYPGIAVIKDSSGHLMRYPNGNLIAIPQLARSISNLPFYLTNGNTPQGIFRMCGFDTSYSPYIGPTPNVQLTMPFETTIPHFLKDTTIRDSVWTTNWYKNLLPAEWQQYNPVWESYYAGKAGRSAIIAHGTTVDSGYYRTQPYYPYTPTQGCLCANEWWSEENGKRLLSDQQQLVDVIIQAGGPDGYCIVLEIDDQQKAVSQEELLPYIKP